MQYRREIDGLRAIAVLPVILFHAGFKAFKGGFVGVDVFFVISGYLITSIILGDMNNGTFSIVNFYERRARRILPTLFFVMLCCLPFAWIWLFPNHFRDFFQSLTAVSVFSSNILFWLESGYFDTAAELKPLLHTWSLAVEEQYYLLFPLFLLLLWKLRKRWIFGTLLSLTFISLAIAQFGAYNKPEATFFLLPTRGWELAIGALIAFYFLYKHHQIEFIISNKIISEIAGFTGLILIFYSIFAFDKSTPFPSIYALIPTIGTGLIIVFSTSDTLVGRLLSSKIMVGIGLISYSAYLWHQPIFAFTRHKTSDNQSTAVLLTLSVLSLLLAYVSWRFIEMPFRDKKLIGRKGIFIFTAIGTLFFATIGIIGNAKKGYPERFNIPDSLTKTFSRSNALSSCFDKKAAHTRDDWYCTLGLKKQRPTFFVFGDSHSLSLAGVFDNIANSAGLTGEYTGISGCAPFLGIHSLRKNQNEKNCYELNKRVFKHIKNNDIKTVFLIARWTYYTEGGYNGDNFSYLGVEKNTQKSMRNSRYAFEYGFKQTIEAYKSIGVTVVVIKQIPQQLIEPTFAYGFALRNKDDAYHQLLKLSVPYEKHKKLQQYTTNIFNSNNYAKILDFDNQLCNSENCPIGDMSQSYYFDDDHLSSAGANLLSTQIKQAFAKYVTH